MAQLRCAFALLSIVFLLGVGIVHGRTTSHARRQPPANVNYAQVFRILEEAERDANLQAVGVAKQANAANGLLGTPTIHPCPSFNAEEDVATIDTAITDLFGEGMGKLITIATERSFSQRAAIYNLYFKNTGKVLTKVLADELGSNSDLYQGFYALLEPAAMRDAFYLYESMAGAGTDDAELNEIIVTRTFYQLKIIAQVYKEVYGTELVDDIAGDSWGIVETLLNKIVTTPRKTEFATPDRVDQLAQELYDAGAGRWGRDDAKFIEIFSSESYTTLRAVFHAYEAKFQDTVLSAVSSEFTRKARDLYMTMVRAILSTPQLFADTIYADIAGLGTYEHGLARHILARADIDLVEIKKQYHSKYKETLTEAVSGDISGDYLKLLIAAIKQEDGASLNTPNKSQPVQVA
ncbi:hypothetical protein CBR_g29796 [Chara braunii]|uniref:Annexin n=1 Tax=Chara braunii TaxID=69332 RepID=A0A388LBE4_CHABU|nr:hypothetical protein CBR_g29796 [Chara braunii]|eukprot:GBG79647.1 hypothetical protein CBR_g29796 [Chara braunii]